MASSDWAPVVGVTVTFMATASVFILRGPLGRALAERLSGRAAPESDQLSAEVEALRHRLSEVEERLDFAERLLARSREAERIGPGGS
jgi:hypothetical protein